jgi:hypothetical protein
MTRPIGPVPALTAGLSFVAAWMLAAGCSANGSGDHLNGPSYDLDAATVDANATNDASTPTLSDGASEGTVAETSVPSEAATPSEGAPPVDAAEGDASDASAVGDANDSGASNCTATTAVLGGNASTLFGAIATGKGAYVTQTLTGGTVFTPTLVAFGAGFQGLVAESAMLAGGNELFGVSFSAGAWGTPVALGGSAATTDAPAAAVVGATVQGVYIDASYHYFHASFTTGWDMGADPVRPPGDASVGAFGPRGAVAAGTATDFVIAYEGNDQHPYAQTWSSAPGWDNGVALATAPLLANTPVAITALDSGANDVLAVFVESGGACAGASNCLYAVTRAAGTKVWSAPALVGATAFSPNAPTLTAIAGGGALLAWKGGDGHGYGSVYAPSASPSWSTPQQVTASQLSLAPAIAPGVCGDDAEAAYVSNGTIYTTHFAGGAWTTPAPLAGAAGVVSLTIATLP